MGASWVAGSGNPPYVGNPHCYRSDDAFPEIAARQLGFTVSNLGCGGATSADLLKGYKGEPPQIGRLDHADWIVLNVGGNDVNFWNVISSGNTMELQQTTSKMQMVETDVQSVLRAVHAANPKAKILMLGYVDFIPSNDLQWKNCVSSKMAQDNVASLHAAFSTLNDNIKNAANANHVTFVNPTSGFAGHGMCDADPWIYRMDKSMALHPNADGQQELGNLVAQAIRKHS